MNLFDALITLLPLAAGAWAAWRVPRWAGQQAPRDVGTPGDWTAGGLPSQPYRDLRRVS